jgi:hypothetical protein
LHSSQIVPVASRVRVHSTVITGVLPVGSVVRVQSSKITGSMAGSRTRVHSSVLAGTTPPPPAGSSIRVIRSMITGTMLVGEPQVIRVWDKNLKVWPDTPRRMRHFNRRTLDWDVVVGAPDSNPTPPDPNGIDHSDPTRDAGAVPIGTASYNIPADAIFVSPTGSDAMGSGSINGPYQSIMKAINAAPVGASTIVLRAGEYNEGGLFIAATKQITIQNYPGEVVWADGSRVTAASEWTASGSTWTAAYGFVLDRSPTFSRGAADSTTPGWAFVNPNYPCAAWPDMVIYDGAQLNQVASMAAVVPGTFYVQGSQVGQVFTPTAIYLGSNPVGHEVRITNQIRFLVMGGQGSKLLGIGVRRYSNSQPDLGVIISSASNTLIENCHVYDTATNALSWQGTGTAGFNCVGRKITVRNAGNLGLHANQADGLLHDRIDVQFCNREHFNPAPASGNIKITRQQGYTLRNSISSNAYDSKAFWADETVANGVIVNNKMIGSGQIGIAIEICTGTWIVANNKVIGAARDGMILINTNKIRRWNNTVVDTGSNALTTVSRCVDYIQDARRPDDGVSPGKDPRQSAAYYQQGANRWVINAIEDFNNVTSRPRSGTQGIWCYEVNPHTTQTFAALAPQVNGNVYGWLIKPTYPFITANGLNNPASYQDLASFQKANPGVDSKSMLVTAEDPVNADGTLKSTYAAAHTNASPLPTDIAVLIGQPAGVTYAGCFW